MQADRHLGAIVAAVAWGTLRASFWTAAAGFGAGVLSGFLFVAAAIAAGTMTRAHGSEIRWPGPHAVAVVRVLDGDTVRVLMRDGPCGRGPCPGQEVSIRLRGIDTAEIHACGSRVTPSCAACPEELAAGLAARAEARRLLEGDRAVRVREIGPDPYAGRFVARLEVLRGGWQDVGALLMASGHAVAYDPGATGSYRKSKPWCARDDPGGAAAGAALGPVLGREGE